MKSLLVASAVMSALTIAYFSSSSDQGQEGNGAERASGATRAVTSSTDQDAEMSLIKAVEIKNASTPLEIETLTVAHLPAELHALSAIELGNVEDLHNVLTVSEEMTVFPLSQSESVNLQTKKSIVNGDLQIAMGNVADHQRSSFQLVFDRGELSSGHVHFFETNQHYRVSTSESGNVLVSLTDPDRDLQTCGCPDCMDGAAAHE